MKKSTQPDFFAHLLSSGETKIYKINVIIIILSEVSQTDIYDITYMQNLKKMIQMNSFRKQTHRVRE